MVGRVDGCEQSMIQSEMRKGGVGGRGEAERGRSAPAHELASRDLVSAKC